MLIGVVFWIVVALLQMYRTGCIVHVFGEELNAISQVAEQAFTYFVLLESGLCAAYLFKMYGVKVDEDYKGVSALFIGLSNMLNRISIKMLIVLLIVSGIFPVFLNLVKVTYLKAMMIILILGIRFIVPYKICLARKTLLIVYEYKYLADIVDSLYNILTILIEILLMKYLKVDILTMLLWGSTVCLLLEPIYKKLINQFCCQVNTHKIEPSYEASNMTRDIIFHQIGGLMNNGIDTIILSVVDLISVTSYQAYNTILYYPVRLMNKVSETYRATIGLKIARKDSDLYIYYQNLVCCFYLMKNI